MYRRYLYSLILFCFFLLPTLAAAKQQSKAIPERIALDNGVIELHLGTGKHGGSLTYLGRSGTDKNLINNHDLGRQIQQSYYAGPNTRRLTQGQHPSWSPWPWNPTQSGDAYGHPSRVLKADKDRHQAYVKTRPNLWDMDNEPCACTMETWVELQGKAAVVRNRLQIQEDVPAWQSQPRHQEMPAVYTIASLSRIMTYVGDAPWTRAPLTRIVKKPIPGRENFPWNYWPSEQYPGPATEMWAAAVNEAGFGLGVFMAEAELFIGGTVGRPGQQSPRASATTYIAPLQTMTLEPGDEVEYTYVLILGDLDEIRSAVYERMEKN
ncbi:MAG: hypothetical protein K9K64_02370 [Desulfohalobiaceae bacterium]|nr:hypothetical protein [Desulfohalobiaceae bacterium]